MTIWGKETPVWGRIRENAGDLLFSVGRCSLGLDAQKLSRQIPLHCGGVVRNGQPTSPQAGTHKIQQRCLCGIHEDRTAAQPDHGRQSLTPLQLRDHPFTPFREHREAETNA